MKKFLIAGSSLAAVAAAGSAGAVDVTLGGSIDMGVEFGLGKNAGNFGFSDAYSKVGLSLAAAGTTDGGIKYGGSFSISTITEIKLNPYEANGAKNLIKATADEGSNIVGHVLNVSGGAAITKNNIVSVKINSAWQGVGGTITGYGLPFVDGIDAQDICKIAGKLKAGTVTVTNGNALAAKNTNGYLPAGKVKAVAGAATLTAGGAKLPVAAATPAVAVSNLAKSDGNTVKVGGAEGKWAAYTNKYSIGFEEVVRNSAPAFHVTKVAATTKIVKSTGKAFADVSAHATALHASAVVSKYVAAAVKTALGSAPNHTSKSIALTKVTKGEVANVYAGPFMEVKLASSTTKMVVGAVCVTREGPASESAWYLDNASTILGASAAKIYVEGGFGKITLQTSDYSGKVSSIGDAGNAAKIDADGLVAVMEGVGLFGANPYLAIDLSGPLNTMEVMTGGDLDLGGLSLNVDAKLSTAGLGAWDMGGTYSLGDMDLGFAYDSDNDWGVSSSMSLAGLAMNANFYSKSGGDHEKSGIYYDVSASTSMNGFGMKLGVDQDLKPELSVSYDVGGLNIYAGYDAADEGGKIGAKLSF